MPRATKAGAAGSTTMSTPSTSSKKPTRRKATPKAKAKSAGPGAAAAADAPTSAEATAPDRTAFIEAQRAQLLAEREAYARSASNLQAEAEQLAEDREPGDVQFDEESGEGDSLNVERERDLALSAQARASMEEIDRALAKIDRGTYGVCERCGERIPEERLEALPHASLCVRCKSGGLGRR